MSCKMYSRSRNMCFFCIFLYMDGPTAREAIPVERNPHQGHRRRMLDKFGRFGVDAFADHELLEVLLYYTIRQGDTNPIAHALMQHFGSLHAVLEATADQLCEVEGVGRISVAHQRKHAPLSD